MTSGNWDTEKTTKLIILADQRRYSPYHEVVVKRAVLSLQVAFKSICWWMTCLMWNGLARLSHTWRNCLWIAKWQFLNHHWRPLDSVICNIAAWLQSTLGPIRGGTLNKAQNKWTPPGFSPKKIKCKLRCTYTLCHQPGRPARLCATAPGSRAVVCLTTWRTRKQTGARATATISLGCVASQSLPQPWHKPRPKMMAVCPCSRPLPKLFTPAEHFQSPLQLWNEALYLTLTQKHLLPRE